MTPKQLQITDFYCRGCHMPHSLDDDGHCEFCRGPKIRYVEFEDLDPVPLIVYILFALGILVIAFGYYLASGQ